MPRTAAKVAASGWAPARALHSLDRFARLATDIERKTHADHHSLGTCSFCSNAPPQTFVPTASRAQSREEQERYHEATRAARDREAAERAARERQTRERERAVREFERQRREADRTTEAGPGTCRGVRSRAAGFGIYFFVEFFVGVIWNVVAVGRKRASTPSHGNHATPWSSPQPAHRKTRSVKRISESAIA